MGRQPTRSLGRIDRKAMRAEAVELFARLGVRIDPDRPTLGLSIADQQIIEIAKAISLDARVLIMDEPTAALSGVEVDRLFAVARSLRDEGRALLFISHRFDEVFALCDTVTVMRDGDYIATSPIADTTVEKIVRQMVGREVTQPVPEAGRRDRRRRARRRGADPARASSTTSRSRCARARSSRSPGWSAPAAARSPGRSSASTRYSSGIGAHPGHAGAQAQPRRRDGARPRARPRGPPQAGPGARLVRRPQHDPRHPQQALASSASSPRAARTPPPASGPAASRSRPPRSTPRPAPSAAATSRRSCSAKWLATEPSVLIVDEPTRGIDVGTKAEVHRLLSELAGQGIAILMISSELPEVLGMADRVLVMREGRITAEIDRADATAESVMFAATHARGRGRLMTTIETDHRRIAGAPRARLVRPRARDQHPDRPPARDRRRDGPQPDLPVQLRRLPRPAADAVDPAARRRRPGDRHHHPQRRPVGRLGAGAHRLPDRAAVHRRPRHPVLAGVPDRHRVRRAARSRSTARWSRSRRCRRW